MDMTLEDILADLIQKIYTGEHRTEMLAEVDKLRDGGNGGDSKKTPVDNKGRLTGAPAPATTTTKP